MYGAELICRRRLIERQARAARAAPVRTIRREGVIMARWLAAVALVALACYGPAPCPGEEPKVQSALKGHTHFIHFAAFSRDGTLATASWDKSVRLWDVKAGREKASYEGIIDLTAPVAFSPDGTLLASG